MSHVSDLDHRRIDATVYPDCVVEVHRKSDRARGLRKVPVTKIWLTERLLGRGTFGEVHLQVQNGEPESKRAVKAISTQWRMSDVECRRELTALLEFSKPKYKDEEVFVHFFGWFQNDNAIFIAMEYLPMGDLENNLQELEKSNYVGCALSEEEVKDIITHILEGIKIMHAEGFAHGDLKPQNVLVVQRKPKWWVKLGGFGLSKRISEGSAFRSHARTQSYMAPEMFHYVPGLNLESSEYTNAVDIWALGCIMYRILTGKPPFLDLFSLQKYCNSPELLMPPISSFKTAAMRREDSFVRLLLTPRPAARPSASVALQDSWFTISDQPNALTVTEVEQKFIYADSTNNPSRYPSTDIRLLPANEGNRESQFNYETASHAGLHSHYHQDLSQDMTVRPVEWPVADLPRMREPMPGAFDVKKFVSIGLPEDIKPTVNKQPNQRFGKPSVKLGGTLLLGDEWNSSDDNFDAEKPKQAFPSVKLKDVKEESDWDRSPVDGVTGTRLPAGPSGFQHFPKMPELAIVSEMSSMLSRVKKIFHGNPEYRQIPAKGVQLGGKILQIYFHTFTGYRIKMLVYQNETIRKIKSRLSKTEGFPTEGLSPSGLRLNFNGELLHDGFTVKECGIEEDSQIELRWMKV